MAHYIKRNHGTESPANYLFWSVSAIPYPSPYARDTLAWRWKRGVALTLRLERGKATRCKTHYLHSPDDLWRTISQSTDKRRPLYVIGNELAHTWRLSEGWQWLERQQPATWKIVIANPPIMMSGKVNGCKVSIMDSYNWFPLSLDMLANSLGIVRHPGPSFTADPVDHYHAARIDCEIMASAFIALVNWWRDNDMGVLGKTLAGCAMNCYRHAFMAKDILHHEIEKCYGLERNCYYGGEVAIKRTGPIPNTVWHLDTNSLYPYVMRNYKYPHKLVKYCEDGSIEWIRARLQEYTIAANVYIRAIDRTYPVRSNGHTIFPEGCYRTFLCGPELQEAIDREDVVEVIDCAAYQHADLFSGYVNHFWRERLEARKRGKPHEELICKMLLNSLYGKFAQRPMVWKAQAQILPPEKWAQWRMTDDIEGRVREFRAIAGQVQELVCEGEPYNTAPIIAACVTAHGREHMRALRSIVPIGNWYYQDTDCLMASDKGMGELLLAGRIKPQELGALKIERVYEGLTIHAPKWYSWYGGHKHAGVKATADYRMDGKLGQWLFNGMLDGMRDRGHSDLIATYQAGAVPRCDIDGIVDVDGFVRPQTVLDAWDHTMKCKESRPWQLALQQYYDQCESGALGSVNSPPIKEPELP